MYQNMFDDYVNKYNTGTRPMQAWLSEELSEGQGS